MLSLDSTRSVSSLDPLPTDSQSEDSHQKFLRFSFKFEENALLALEHITEVIRLNIEEILPVPEVSDCVLGITNWRGEMLWLVDLGQLAGDPPLFARVQGNKLLPVIVVQAKGQSLGFAVLSIGDIELKEPTQIQPIAPGLFPPKLLPLLSGYLPSRGGAVLDAVAIMQLPLWKLPP